jgi:hypothetical protein
MDYKEMLQRQSGAGEGYQTTITTACPSKETTVLDFESTPEITPKFHYGEHSQFDQIVQQNDAVYRLEVAAGGGFDFVTNTYKF